MKKGKNNHGFTLGELLIVIGIIAVLVAISIPIFTGATGEKSSIFRHLRIVLESCPVF